MEQPKQTQKPIKLKRALTVDDMLNAKFETWPISAQWRRCIGEVATNFSMIIWGLSGKGKTRFFLSLCKELSNHGLILIDCMEEGKSRTLQVAYQEMGMKDIAGKLILADREPYEYLVHRLKRKKSPKIVIINSVQHMRLTYEQWKELRAMFRKKCFILISHADGATPSGAAAKEIRYDVDIKVHVENYVAYPVSRYGGNTPYVIWPDKAVIKPEHKQLLQAQAKTGEQLPLLNNETNPV